MRIFTFSKSDKTILYLNPFLFEDLYDLLPDTAMCSTNMFVGYHANEIFSFNKRFNSPKLQSLQTPVQLIQLRNLIYHHKIQPYEFHLEIDGIDFKNFLGSSVLISIDKIRISKFLKTFSLPENILSLSNQTLTDIDKNGIPEQIGVFDSPLQLFNYLFDEIYEFEYLNSECPF